MEAIELVYEELNRPSLAKLKTVLRKRGIEFTPSQLESLAKTDTGRQLLAPQQQYKGRIFSDGINDRWAADLSDFTACPDKGAMYILVVQDIFTRRVFATALKKNDSKTGPNW